MELRRIPDHSELYMAGSDGYIYSLVSGTAKQLVGAFDGQKRYLHVWAYPIGKRRRSMNVHVLVCSAFHGPRPSPNHTASHLNGDRLDNRPENLVWELHAENLSRKRDHGTDDAGVKNSRSVMTSERLQMVHSMIAQGYTHQAVAEALEVSRTTISRIVNGHRYRT